MARRDDKFQCVPSVSIRKLFLYSDCVQEATLTRNVLCAMSLGGLQYRFCPPAVLLQSSIISKWVVLVANVTTLLHVPRDHSSPILSANPTPIRVRPSLWYPLVCSSTWSNLTFFCGGSSTGSRSLAWASDGTVSTMRCCANCTL